MIRPDLAARPGATHAVHLLRRGVSINTRGAEGSALWFACCSGDLEAIDRPVAAGIENRNDSSAACLVHAASAGKAIVTRLPAADARLNHAGLDGLTAPDLAATQERLRLQADKREGRRPAGAA